MPEHTNPAEFGMRPLGYANLSPWECKAVVDGSATFRRSGNSCTEAHGILAAAIRRHDVSGADVPGTPASILPVARLEATAPVDA